MCTTTVSHNGTTVADYQAKDTGDVDTNALDTLGGRLKWVRENALELSSLIRAETFLQALPDEERPNDTSQKTLGRYEKDQQSPRCDLLSAYAKHSGIAIRWIFNGEGPRYAEPIPDPDDPFVGSLIHHAETRAAEHRRNGVIIGLDYHDLVRAYEDVLKHRWPRVEIARLDQWRDQLMKEYEFEEVAREPGEEHAWAYDGAGGILSPGGGAVVGAMINWLAHATPDEVDQTLSKFGDNSQIRDEIAKQRDRLGISKEPSVGDHERVVDEDLDPTDEDVGEAEGGGGA